MSETIGNPKQLADLDRINRTAEQLSVLISNYYKDHGTMLSLSDVKTITPRSTSVEIIIGNANPDYAKDSPQ